MGITILLGYPVQSRCPRNQVAARHVHGIGISLRRHTFVSQPQHPPLPHQPNLKQAAPPPPPEL